MLANVTADNLTDAMEFDCPIQVHADGTVTRAPESVYAPELNDGEVSSGWTLLGGHSGQYGYAGPIMHNSEFVSGGMADRILSEPGIYVTVANYGCGADDDAEGWAVARMGY